MICLHQLLKLRHNNWKYNYLNLKKSNMNKSRHILLNEVQVYDRRLLKCPQQCPDQLTLRLQIKLTALLNSLYEC